MALKSDRIQLKLIKLDQEEWSALTDEIDQKKAQRAERVVRNVRFAESQLRSQAHGDLANASTQELLADMYANATDEERFEDCIYSHPASSESRFLHAGHP